MYGHHPAPRHGVPGPAVAAIAVICTVFGLVAGCITGAASTSSAPAAKTGKATPPVAPRPEEPDTAAPAYSPLPTTDRARDRETHRPIVKPTPTHKPTVKPKPQAPSTDPRYPTCAAAKKAGHGPYRRGIDREYSWYIDRDGDGVVCE